MWLWGLAFNLLSLHVSLIALPAHHRLVLLLWKLLRATSWLNIKWRYHYPSFPLYSSIILVHYSRSVIVCTHASGGINFFITVTIIYQLPLASILDHGHTATILKNLNVLNCGNPLPQTVIPRALSHTGIITKFALLVPASGAVLNCLAPLSLFQTFNRFGSLLISGRPEKTQIYPTLAYSESTLIQEMFLPFGPHSWVDITWIMSWFLYLLRDRSNLIELNYEGYCERLGRQIILSEVNRW